MERMTEGNPMEPTSRKGPTALRSGVAAQVPAGSRIASGSPIAGTPIGAGRHVRISQAAYYKAQQRGFVPGHDWEDWFAAEREVTESDDEATVGTPR